MDYSEVILSQGIGPNGTLFNQAVQLPIGETTFSLGAKSIDSGLRKRKLFWLPAVNGAMHIDYISCRWIFRKAGNVVAEFSGAYMGNDPNTALAVVSPMFPFSRLDSSALTFPIGSLAPLASDPNSRQFQWFDATGGGWSAQFVMQGYEVEIDANEVELINTVYLKSADTTPRRQVICALVASGRLMT